MGDSMHSIARIGPSSPARRALLLGLSLCAAYSGAAPAAAQSHDRTKAAAAMVANAQKAYEEGQ